MGGSMPHRVAKQEAVLRQAAPATPDPTVALVDEDRTEQWSSKRGKAFAEGVEWACEQYGHRGYFATTRVCLCGKSAGGAA